MVTKVIKATTKASLKRALRANKIKFSSIEVLKRASETIVGKYRVTYKMKK